MSRSTSLCVFLFLGICMGIVTATARDAERENMELFGGRWTPVSLWVHSWRERNIQATPSLSSPPPLLDPTLLWHHWRHHHHHHHHHHPPHVPWGHHHRHHPNNPTPPPKPPSPPHVAPQPAQPPRVAPSPVDNVVPPSHATPQPTLPLHTASSLVDDVVPPPPLPPHTTPLLSPSSCSPPTPLHEACIRAPSSSHSPAVKPPPAAPSGGESSDCLMVLINVDGCVSELITSFFKDEISLSTGCCKVVSRISDDCFYRGFTHFSVPVFLSKVRDYCGH